MSQFYRLVRPCNHDTFVTYHGNHITPCRDGIPIAAARQAVAVKTNAFCPNCLLETKSYLKPSSAVADLSIAAPAWDQTFIRFPLGEVAPYFLKAARNHDRADWKLENIVDRQYLIDAHLCLQHSSRRRHLKTAQTGSFGKDSIAWAGTSEILDLITEMMEFNLVVDAERKLREPKKKGVLKRFMEGGSGKREREEVKKGAAYRTPSWLRQLIIGSDDGTNYYRRLTLDELRLRGSR